MDSPEARGGGGSLGVTRKLQVGSRGRASTPERRRGWISRSDRTQCRRLHCRIICGLVLRRFSRFT
eukprot:460743-Hanusia_phi.AAC.1